MFIPAQKNAPFYVQNYQYFFPYLLPFQVLSSPLNIFAYFSIFKTKYKVSYVR